MADAPSPPPALACGACGQHRPKTEFSPTQLKKKGKRKCFACVAAAVARGGGPAPPSLGPARPADGPRMSRSSLDALLDACPDDNKLATVQRLVRRAPLGCVNQQDPAGFFALYDAAGSGSVRVVKWLVTERKANVDLQNNQGSSPLHIAAQEGHAEVVQFLVENKAT
jgi:ankyrin repeat protein